MKELSTEQKIMVMRLLLDIVLADGYVDKRETQFFELLTEQMGLDNSCRDAIQQQNPLFALMEISKLPADKKRDFVRLMGKMIVIDEKIHYKEVEIYNLIRDVCGIESNMDDILEFDS